MCEKISTGRFAFTSTALGERLNRDTALTNVPPPQMPMMLTTKERTASSCL